MTYHIVSTWEIEAEGDEAARKEFRELAGAGKLPDEEWRLIDEGGAELEVSERAE